MDIKKIAVVGPESSGKSTLSKKLAKELNGIWVPEFSRIYLEEKGTDYDEKDVAMIGKGQFELEQKAIQEAKNTWVVCDTDLVVIKIWMMYKYHNYPSWIDNKLDKDSLYLLCKPDMPWEPDPLRENPNDRDDIYHAYINELEKSGLKFKELEGSVNQRLTSSLEWLRKFQ